MAPITVMDNELVGLQQEIGLRARWDSAFTTADINPKFLLSQKLLDPKAVGGHRLLGKRSSNPIGMNYNQLKMSAATTLQHQQQQQQQQQQPLPPLVNLSSPPRGMEESLLLQQQQHRRLDRSKSEPVRSQPASPTDSNRSSSSSRYKTELCRPFGETGFCKYGEKCQFAHGIGELRNMPRHPKYKTELCRTFHTTGLCGYGSRCHFIHNADERRNPSPTQGDGDHPLISSPPSSLSPTLHGCTFFDDTFKVSDQQQQQQPPPMYSPFIGLETPPTSPVESLAGDMDSMSLSTSPSRLSISPPTNTVHLCSFKDNFRLPIFETLTEVP